MDCCFVMDATSSMKPYIDSVRTKFKDMVTSIRKDFGHLKLRVALVAYRDYNDANPVQVLDFTSSEEDFVKYLEGCASLNPPVDQQALLIRHGVVMSRHNSGCICMRRKCPNTAHCAIHASACHCSAIPLLFEV